MYNRNFTDPVCLGKLEKLQVDCPNVEEFEIDLLCFLYI